jgi:hypothetical protein
VKKIILISVVLFATWTAGQEISIKDFSGGLNTEAPPLQMGQTDAAKADNLIFDQGGLAKRKGYISVASHDSTLRGLYAFNFSQFSRLIGVYDRPATSAYYGLGKQVSSRKYEYALQKSTAWTSYDWVYTGCPPYWTTWRDMAIMSNGRQRPVVYVLNGAGFYGRDMVLTAPGEPYIVPVADSGDYLNGTYRYLIYMETGCTDTIGSLMNVDPSLETWVDGDDLTNWTEMIPSGATLTRQTGATGAFGTWCLRAYTTTTGEIIGIRDTVATTPGAYYRGRAYMKLLNAGSGLLARAVFKIMDSSGNIIYRDVINEQDEWIKSEYTFVASDSYVEISCYCYNSWIGDGVDFQADSVAVFEVTGPKYKESYISQPVSAYYEKVLLTRFPTGQPVMGRLSACDSLILKVYRTQADPGVLDKNDPFYMVYQSDDYMTEAQINALKIIDSLADDSIIYNGVIYPDSIKYGRDTADTITGNRLGAPTYVGRNDSAQNIFSVPFSTSVTPISMSYICTFVDTLLDIESDSSRSLWVYYKSTSAADTCYQLGLPPIPYGLTWMTRRLYRSYTYSQPKKIDSIGAYILDTTITLHITLLPNYWDQSWNEAAAFVKRVRNEGRYVRSKPEFPAGRYEAWKKYGAGHQAFTITYYEKKASDSTLTDTVTTDYFLIDEITSATESLYYDIVPFDSMMKGQVYAHIEAPHNLNLITSFGDELWGAVGATLFRTRLDSIGVWGYLRSVDFNNGDGSIITAIVPARDYIKVYMNNSQYIVYSASLDAASVNWVQEGYGCIAPRSMTKCGNGLIYLSYVGVVNEGASATLERGSSAVIISDKIKNLILDRRAQELYDARAFIYDNKYFLTFGHDTTFVCHLNMPGYPWSIWTFDFWQTANYDINIKKNKAPSTDLIFITGADDDIYKFDTTRSDAGTAINTAWKSSPLGVTGKGKWAFAGLGIWQINTGSGLRAVLYDEVGDSVKNKIMTNTRYKYYSFEPPYSGYFQVLIRDSTTLSDSLKIEQIDIYAGDRNARGEN